MIDLALSFPKDFFAEEVRCGYTVTKEMKELWAVQLDLLAEFDRVCKNYNIHYMACGGTMLGAVRHKGYIPWDDDIDLMMFREEYEKLCAVAEEAFSEPYFFQNGYTDKGTVRGHGQLRNCRTTAIREAELKYGFPFNQGIFIDIFPLDKIPNDSHELKVFLSDVEEKRKNVLSVANRAYRYTKKARKLKTWYKRPLWDARHLVAVLTKAENKAFIKYDQCMQRFNSDNTQKVATLSVLAAGERTHWYIEDLNSPLQLLPFEFMTIPVPENYKRILDIEYGNWEEYVVGGSVHGELFVDTNLSYLSYIR